MPVKSSRIIIKERAQPHPFIVSDRRTRELQINAPNDKHIVNDKLVISARDNSMIWFSKFGRYCWLRFCQKVTAPRGNHLLLSLGFYSPVCHYLESLGRGDALKNTSAARPVTAMIPDPMESARKLRALWPSR